MSRFNQGCKCNHPRNKKHIYTNVLKQPLQLPAEALSLQSCRIHKSAKPPNAKPEIHKGLRTPTLKLQASHPYVVPGMWYVSWTTFSVTGILLTEIRKQRNQKKGTTCQGTPKLSKP